MWGAVKWRGIDRPRYFRRAGALFGALLGIASIAFRVKSDDRIEKCWKNLPGANCGGCGFAGCANFAEAVVSGKAGVNGCPVSNDSQRARIAEVMGQTATDNEPVSAVVFVQRRGRCCRGKVQILWRRRL